MASNTVSSFTYDVFQQIHCHSAAAGIAGGSHGTQADLEKGFQAALHDQLPLITGSWNLLWGPTIYKQTDDPKTGPDNAWYIAIDNVQKICVVAIAGTAVTSGFDIISDIEVRSAVDFDKWASKWTSTSIPPLDTTPWKDVTDTRALCAYGTCDFIRNVLGTPSPASAALPNTTIIQILQKLQATSPSYSIVFTGHSSGAAASCAIAYGLVQSKLLNNTNLSVLPTAAPNPGNALFNANFAKYFPPKTVGTASYHTYNVVLYNTLDIVPQAWSINTTDDRHLLNICSIYSWSFLSPAVTLAIAAEIVTVVGAANAALYEFALPYRVLPGIPFTGPTITASNGNNELTTLDEVYKSIALQHSPAYWGELGIQAFVDGFKQTLHAQPGVGPLQAIGTGNARVEAFEVREDLGIHRWQKRLRQRLEAAKRESAASSE